MAGIWTEGTFPTASKLAAPLFAPNCVFLNKLAVSILFNFKLILLDKVDVSAFLNN